MGQEIYHRAYEQYGVRLNPSLDLNGGTLSFATVTYILPSTMQPGRSGSSYRTLLKR